MPNSRTRAPLILIVSPSITRGVPANIRPGSSCRAQSPPGPVTWDHGEPTRKYPPSAPPTAPKSQTRNQPPLIRALRDLWTRGKALRLKGIIVANASAPPPSRYQGQVAKRLLTISQSNAQCGQNWNIPYSGQTGLNRSTRD